MSTPDFERELLRSADSDAPTPERRRAVRAATMLAAGFAAPPAIGKPAAAATKLGAFKIIVAAVVAIGGIAALVVLVKPPPPVPAPPLVPTASFSEPPPSPSETASTDPAPPPPPPPVASPPRRATSAAPSADPLAVEARLLEEARRCLGAGDTACATAKLAEHRASFPHGALVDEAALLRIEVLRARGDRAGAKALAEEMIRQNPSGPYARRARAILAALTRD